jgi:peptidoglycan hydrolase-like protein with peptidoglycan-binding domain
VCVQHRCSVRVLARLVVLLAGFITAALLAASTAAASSDSLAASTPTQPAPGANPPRLRVLAVAPRVRTVLGDAMFTVHFSTPLAPGGQRKMPKLAPALAGAWSQPTATSLRFTPTGAYLPGTVIHLTVPAGTTAADGAVLGRAVTRIYRVGEPSSARLPQLLADLRYLPVHFVSSHDPRAGDLDAQLRALYSPPSGRFVFGRGWPAELHSLWAVDNAVVLKGAVMNFEAEHGLPMDGIASPQVWKALIQARASWRLNRSGYSYAVGSEASPESLTVYHNGAAVLSTPANTGIAAAPTAQGTFPVYERLRSQVMTGTNPDGSHYADYVQWVAYFNGGDAVHYMPRSGYGSPQSLGCIELPYAAAEQAWGYLTYGTLVTVTG